jgi:deoxyribonuclease-4
MRYLGCWVPTAGGLFNGVKNGEALGVNTIMLHPSPPQRWHTKEFDPAAIAKFNEAMQASSIVKKVHMHGIYLTNLANPDKQKFHLSKLALMYYLNLAEKINGEGVVFHTGSLKDTTEEEGLDRVARGLEWIFENADSTKPLMLECAAGAGSVIGDKLEELKTIFDLVDSKYKSRVKFCLDTQHMWASGYDLVNHLDDVIDSIDENLGLENILCIHFNDSKTELNSNKDRHENLGNGLIGESGMKNILNHPKLKHIDFVMETPDVKSVETAKSEVNKLQGWAE